MIEAPTHRPTVHALTLGLAVLAALAFGPTLVRASQATPAASAEQVAKEALGRGQSAVAPGRELLLQRRTFAPGASSGAHPAPGPVVLTAESGTVGFAVEQGAAQLTHAGMGSGTAPELVSAGTEVMLHQGDSVFYDQGVIHTVRNAGDDPAVTLEARLNPVTGSAGAAASPTAATSGSSPTGATAA